MNRIIYNLFHRKTYKCKYGHIVSVLRHRFPCKCLVCEDTKEYKNWLHHLKMGDLVSVNGKCGEWFVSIEGYSILGVSSKNYNDMMIFNKKDGKYVGHDNFYLKPKLKQIKEVNPEDIMDDFI